MPLKSAEQWVESWPVSVSHTQERRTLVRAIQADVLRHAADRITRHTGIGDWQSIIADLQYEAFKLERKDYEVPTSSSSKK